MQPEQKNAAVRIAAYAFLTFFTFAVIVAFVGYVARTPEFHFVYADGLKQIGGYELWSVVGAFLIGLFGSAAFLLAVAYEVVPHPAQAKIKVLIGTPGVMYLYVFLGGVVAGIFQLAQPTAFAPVQALVMGVTWPSVISQYLGNNKDNSTDALKALSTNLADGNQKKGELI